MSFDSYPEYKQSGVTWLGQAPSHWHVAPLKTRFGLKNGWPFSAEEFDWSGQPEDRVVRIRDILGTEDRAYTEERCPADAVIRDGDVIVGMDGDFNVKYWNEGPAKLNQRLCALRGPDTKWDRFLYHLLPIPLAIINDLTFSTTVKHLSSKQVRNIRIPDPPEEEMSNIVAFLDHETARIDALIDEQQRLIRLLSEEKLARMSLAVTQGIRTGTKLQHSGVGWLGDIPEHWTVSKIKWIVSTPVTDGPHETPTLIDEGVPFLSAEAVKNGKLDFSKKRGFISETEHNRFSKKYSPKPKDIYLVKSGATTGASAIVEEDCEFNIWSPLAAIRCGAGVLPEFALGVIRSHSFQQAIVLYWNYGTQQNIGMEVIENFAFPVPPMEEQAEIVDRIASESGQTEALIEEALRSKELLQERRRSLISAAVTGQIDVREWKPTYVADRDSGKSAVEAGVGNG